MPYAVKNILLSLTFLFAFFSLHHGAAKELETAATQYVDAQDEVREVTSVLYRSPALLQAEEQHGFWQSRPVPMQKQASYGSPALAAKAQEFRLQLLVAYYLQRTRHSIPGLSGCDIIFPFHYFW